MTRKVQFKRTLGAVLALGLALAGVSLSTGWIKSADLVPISMTRSAPARIDKLFKSLGVIKLAGIAPPVDIVLEDLNAKTVRVSDFKGKIVLLNFWTTWCPECRVEMPSLEKLYQRFKDREFVMIAINLKESSKVVNAFFKKNSLSFMSLLDTDGEIGFRFGIRSIPTTFILDKRGGLIAKIIGSRAWDGKKSAALFENLINSKSLTASTNKEPISPG